MLAKTDKETGVTRLHLSAKEVARMVSSAAESLAEQTQNPEKAYEFCRISAAEGNSEVKMLFVLDPAV